MKNIKSMISFSLIASMLLCGCKGNSAEGNDELSIEDKTEIYQQYFDDLSSKSTDSSYYMYDVHSDDTEMVYQMYNRKNYKQYVFMEDESKEQFEFYYDNEYAYLITDVCETDDPQTIRVQMSDTIESLADPYTLDIKGVLSNIELESVTKTETMSDEYYLDTVKLGVTIDGTEYTGEATYYINSDHEVKVNEGMDILLIGSFAADGKTYGLTVYESEDKNNEIEEVEYTVVTEEEFTKAFEEEISQLQ